MQVYAKWTDLRARHLNIAVALGMFDGVHIGHQSIVRRAVLLAKECGGTSVVFSFRNHPLSVLAPHRLPLQIGSPELREQILRDLGVDVLLAIPFTKELAEQSPEDFLALLRQYLAPRYVVTGPNYTFGKKGKGTQRMLLRMGNAYGFQAEVCPAVIRGGRPVSSTRIRALLDGGDLAEANAFLGYPFSFIGRVVHGEQRGRTLGFPTANLLIPDMQAMLPNGVYAAHVWYEGTRYDGLVNIGNNPTFEGCSRRIEVHIRDFHEMIYDRAIRVAFLEKLREEKKFASVDDLVKQIQRDRHQAELVWAREGIFSYGAVTQNSVE